MTHPLFRPFLAFWVWLRPREQFRSAKCRTVRAVKLMGLSLDYADRKVRGWPREVYEIFTQFVHLRRKIKKEV